MNHFLIVALTANLLFVTSVYSQNTVQGNTASGAFEYLGWGGGTSKDLYIQNNFGNKNIVLWTNDSSSTQQRMTILGSNGHVGIGTTPITRLDVNGTINIRSGEYRISNSLGTVSARALFLVPGERNVALLTNPVSRDYYADNLTSAP
jgi:hypothetical protein